MRKNREGERLHIREDSEIARKKKGHNHLRDVLYRMTDMK